MDPMPVEWNKVLEINPQDVEGDKTLLEDLYTLFMRNKLPETIEEGEQIPIQWTVHCFTRPCCT